MRQYGVANTNFTAGDLLNFDAPIRHEALLGSSYKKMVRGNRRAINHDPVEWWRKQIMTSCMANLYHCGGYGK